MTASPSDRLTSIVEGAEPERIGPWLARRLHDPAWRDCTVSLIAGGKSNLTYLVASRAGELVFRRPPLGHILPTAHDMAREHRVIAALGRTAFPVPRTLLYSTAEDNPLGVQCYAMERVIGHICRDELPAGYADEPEQCRALAEALVDVLADLHLTEPAAIGLADFGRPEGFMERQLKLWSKQWERSKTHELPALEALRDELVRSKPERFPQSLVHGDFRLDNCVLHAARPDTIVAVLDWEMSTLGDPLADFAAMLAYWADAGEDEPLAAARIVPPLTRRAGFLSRRALIERYAARTALDVSRMDWYLAFAYFKLAVICQGIATRAAGGAMLGSGFDDAQRLVELQVRAGLHVLERPLFSQAA
jgi:aminoglycoside phosphotransferase (APT) family kinase protein